MKPLLTLISMLITLTLVACTQTVNQPEPTPLPPQATVGKKEVESSIQEEKRAIPGPVSMDATGMTASRPAMALKQRSAFTTHLPGRLPSEPLDRERYAHYDENPVKRVAETPVSTF
ncbi:MAG: hypothetical protein ABW120_02895, partial [Sedimenticola sp.]